MSQGPPGLVCCQQSQLPPTAPELVSAHPRVFRKRDLRVGRMLQVKGVDVVDDIHFVAQLGKRMSESVHIHGIAAETIGRVERGEMKESQGLVYRPFAAASRIESI